MTNPVCVVTLTSPISYSSKIKYIETLAQVLWSVMAVSRLEYLSLQWQGWRSEANGLIPNTIRNTGIQASAAKQMGTATAWVIKQRVMVVSYRSFGQGITTVLSIITQKSGVLFSASGILLSHNTLKRPVGRKSIHLYLCSTDSKNACNFTSFLPYVFKIATLI